MRKYDLLIFDVDGTLTPQNSVTILPERVDFFRHLGIDPPSTPKIALATNHGGVGFRHWLATTPPPWFTDLSQAEQRQRLDVLPTQAQAEDRLRQIEMAIRQATQELRPFPLVIRSYCSFAYQFKSGNWATPPPEAEGDPRWLEAWRKPGAGLLLQAMVDAGVSETQTLMIGDRPEDEAAATGAGCDFAWAEDFFISTRPKRHSL